LAVIVEILAVALAKSPVVDIKVYLNQVKKIIEISILV